MLNNIYKKIDLSYIINICLLILVLSIPYKNFFYQLSSVSLFLIFIYTLKIKKDYFNIKKIFYIYKDIFILFFLLLFSMLFSTLLNFERIEQIELIIKYFFRYGVIFFILIYFYKNKLFIVKNLLYYIILSFLLVAFNGYFEYFFHYNLYSEKNVGVRLEGGMFSPNIFGLYMSLAAIFFTILYYDKLNGVKKNIFYFSMIVFFLFLSLHSGSRSSWLMYVVFFVVYNIEIYRKINKSKIFTTLCILTIIISIIVYIDNSVMNRFNALINLNPSSRDKIWETMIPYILDKPFLGYGIDSFKNVVDFRIISAHNSILEILLYIGVFGFFVFSLIIYTVIKETIINNMNYIGICMSFMLVLLFDHSVFTNKIFLTILTIFVFFIFISRVENKEEKL